MAEGTGTTARNHLGRLNADGSLDAGFNPGADGLVWTFAVQPDGKILVGGQFSALGGGGTGTTPRIAIGRLNPDGSLDGTFNPGAYDGYTGSPGVFTMALQADGKIVVGGRFSALGGGTGTSPRSCIGRLNADGSVDVSFDPGANDYVWAAAVQPDGKILVGGNFYTIGGGGSGTETHYYLARLNIDGSVDADFHPDAWGWTQVIMMQPDGKILAGGGFTEIASLERNHIARLYPDGSVDADFNPGANGYSVSTIAIQPDGKILVGGNFTTLGGGNAGYYTRSRIGRLVPDGALDWSFDPGADGTVAALTVQPDGKILVGGCFSTIGGGGTGTTTRYNIARLLPDGTLDSSFNPGANDCVGTIAVQPDGKILVGGQFHTLGGGGTGSYPRYHIGRLNADGSIDASFDPGASDIVFNMTMQHDGKIVVGGWFHALGGGGTGYYSRYHIGRLNADGSIDSFDPGANDDVTGIVVEPTGTILVSGWFTTIGGGGTGYWTRNHIARLSTDGTVDSGFDPGVNYGVWSLARQADGKVVVGGWFSGMGGGTGTTVRNNIGRLHHDGSLDTTFDPGANGAVYALALQADGKVVVGGNFSTLGGGGTGTTARSTIGRVTNPDTAAEDLRVGAAGNAVTWYRSGAAPDFRHVTFESSSDGVAYTALGEAVLGADGWELTGLSLPTNQHLFIRARGRYETGFANTNGSIAESVRHAWLAAGGATGDVITTIAGTGAAVFSGDGGPATAAGVTSPFDLAVDGAGNIYLTDHMNYRVRKVWASSGSITTVAGTGVQGSSGDGGPATAAQLYTPTGIGLDSSGNLYIADYSACVVRKVTTATGLISTVAGTGTCAYNGDGRVGTATWLNNPYDVTVDAAGNLYVAEFTGSRVRKVAASTSIVTTFAGTGGLGYGGDGGAATSATLYNPTCLAADGSYLYIADTNNYRVRKVQLASGIIVTAAGTGIQGFSGDGGPATAARLNLPFGLAVDAAGSLYIADQFNQRVRKVSAGQNTITTVAGTGSVGFSGDGGPATAAALNYPQGVAVDAAGLLNIADTQNNRIRKVGPAPPPVRRGDFTGDFKADILWRHATQGEVWLWPMDGATRASESYVRTVADTDWEIRGVGDFTGGGTADVLWRNKTSGQVYLWPMDGSSPLDEIYVAAVDPAYDIVGTGDFNGDGKADILWRHMTQGDVWVWLMDGATPLDQVYVDWVPLRYQVRGVGDLDADANADIVWRSATAGDVWVWRMNGATRLDVVWIGTVPELGYDIQAVDDFDGDGRADILWWHATHGEVWIWTDERHRARGGNLGGERAGHGVPGCQHRRLRRRRQCGHPVAPRDARRSVDLADGRTDPRCGIVGRHRAGRRVPRRRGRRTGHRHDHLQRALGHRSARPSIRRAGLYRGP